MYMAKPARLITIPFSHYCEKARWALDATGLPYVEDKYLPMMHKLATLAAGGNMVPVLVTRHGAIKDSAKILTFCDAHAPEERRLYPRDASAQAEVAKLETTFNDVLGPATRLYGYFHALPHAKDLASLVAPGMTKAQRFLFPFAVPLVAPMIRKGYHVNRASASKAREKIRKVFADVSAHLEGKRYLVGDRFGAADLTFASLSAPALLPEGHPAWGSDASRLPGEIRELLSELRATRAGEHVMRMYAEHRHARA
jgi:glutathione S-transferase